MKQETSALAEIKVPAYRRIERQIRAQIGSGRWSVGAMLPSRHSLASEYKVSLGTVERAVTSLIADGVLSASDRRGTFVNSGGRVAVTDAPEVAAEPSVSNRSSAEESPDRHGTPTLGIIATYIDEVIDSAEYLAYWMRQTAQALATAFLNLGEISAFYNLHTDNPAAKVSVAEGATELLRQGVTAIAVLDLHNQIAPGELDRLVSAIDLQKTPLVYVSSSEIDADLPHVYCDSPNAGKQAFQYCLKQGASGLTFVAAAKSRWILERYDAICAAAASAGWQAGAVSSCWLDPPLSNPLLSGKMQRTEARVLGRDMLSQPDRYSRCIVAANDYTAYGIIDAARELGLTPGKDFMVVGFDDAPNSLPYGLTSLRPPLEQLGQEAARMLNRIEREGPTTVQMRVRWQLVERASTRFFRP